MRRVLSLFLVLLLVSPAFALRKRKKETKKKGEETAVVQGVSPEEFNLLKADLKQLMEKVALLEEAIKTSEQVNSEAMMRIKQLEARLSRLETKIDELLLKIKGTTTTQTDYSESPETETTSSAPVTGVKASELYKKGFDAYIKEHYGEAITYFRQYAENFPQSALADNALFWCGESYYRMNNFYAAITMFEKMLKLYPDSDKAPSALLELVNCYRKIGNKKEARRYLQELKTKYPDSKEASSIK